ncbi:hypothetical protein [Pontibacter chinhatensis]|uniref:Uncharacterized protein n=1 Tax=Pontibacter chinhatensis TaxID=1436961 RepID=A0A1I2XPQ0_9BACT|nr:hypothetical protein [Pontibacter chinhatensis]SFH14061.1 hypothetical protein SAMN05421739_106110 [Pontibacter chinhatensis]
MKIAFTLILLAMCSIGATAQTKQQVPSKEAQIKAALLAAPAEKRDGAAVYGYDASGKFVLLRKGTNELICLADDPKQEGLSVSCYHKNLEPFMARGRELRQAGKSTEEIFQTREAETKSGKLKMPKEPTTLFVYTADANAFNAATGEVKDGYLRYVVYIPYATAESTGLPLKPDAPAMPWIMHPGTHGAHIMINPPRK